MSLFDSNLKLPEASCQSRIDDAVPGAGLAGWAHAWRALRAACALWAARGRARRALAAVDARSLRDAGIPPGMAEYEAAQPFWRALRDRRD